MIPPLLPSLLLVRPVRPLDRVADARGRHVAHIRINTPKTRWTLKKTGVNANALHAADACVPPPLVCFSHAVTFFHFPHITQSVLLRSYLCLLFPPSFLASRGAVLAFLATAIRVFTCTNTISHTRHSKEARTTNFCLFFFPCLPTSPPHDNDELQPEPPQHVLTYIPPPSTTSHRFADRSAVVKHISLL
jgi:hypothetical protein